MARAIHRARVFYSLKALLSGTEFYTVLLQDFLIVLVEQGAKYSDMEYEIILNLHSRSQAVIDKEASRQRLAKLKEILRELRVNQQTQV